MGTVGLLALVSVRAEAAPCAQYAAPAGAVAVEGPVESSGLAWGRRDPSRWFTHDDSGGRPRLWSFSPGDALAVAHPGDGLSFVDWEDLAAGPCTGAPGDCLFIADIGDNLAIRPFITVHEVEEPAPGAPLVVRTSHVGRHPGGPVDAEALLVHPCTGAIDILTKSATGDTAVHRLPPGGSVAAPAEMARIGALRLSEGPDAARQVTGADWSPDGSFVAVRTYAAIWVHAATVGEDTGWWATPGVALAGPDEAQGEAITVGAGGSLWTSSEGAPMPLHHTDCLVPAAGDTGCPPAPDTAPEAPAGDSNPDGPPRARAGAGCGCAATPGAGGGAAVALGIALLAGARRRPRR
jgi:MYXO-CTERM domain-containing protein